MADDVLLRDLCQTVSERQMFEKKLRELRAEVRLCKASLEALVQKEEWLRKEAFRPRASSGQPIRTLGGFIGDGTVFFTLEQDDKHTDAAFDESPQTIDKV